ncbi:lipase family protein [Gordonia polyisoprenivorans]|uniref:lipase family protein n=1 Tax=Gordonia polyisoprenivorans TaxID=84595 RepID=UPI00038156B1|nr:lipase family protein [Gordonia polyisoprenivorans]
MTDIREPAGQTAVGAAPSRRLAGWWLAILVIVAVVATGCSSNPDPAPTDSGDPGVAYDVNTSGTGPGALRAAQTMPYLDRRVTAQASTALRIRYASTDGRTGAPTTVWGAVFVPSSARPADGWDTVVLAHGTTGLLGECGVTLDPTLGDLAATAAAWLEQGYVVVVPEYQGLGYPGSSDPTHPYLDARTEGMNVIDGVRAARALVPGVSTRWAALGGSQGGQAVWAANTLAGTYGAGLDLRGTASLSPAAQFSGLVDLATRRQLTLDQYGLYTWLILAVQQENPGFDLGKYVRGAAKSHWDELAQCLPVHAQARASILRSLSPDDLTPDSPADAAALTALLARRAVPDQRPAAPMLVLYGGRDQLIDSRWTAAAIGSACANGATLQSQFQPDADHGGVAGDSVVGWILNRFDDEPAFSTCGTAPGSEQR